MASISPGAPAARSPVGTLLIAALVVVLAWQLAYWTWVFMAPPAAVQGSRLDNDVDLAAVARLFGAAAPAEAQATASTSGLRLKGVVAPTPGTQASAIFSTGSGRDIAVYLDREVQPGVRLTAVHPDHVIVSRAGVPERIDLDVARSAPGTSPATPKQGGFRLNVAKTASNSYAISRKELDEALRDPNQLGYLGQIGMPPGGGVRMEQAPAGSLAQKLGLQPGDIIRKVNGQAVAGTGDLARLYTQFNTTDTIQADVQRGGTTVQLSYSIRP